MNSPSVEEIWQQVCSILKQNLSPSAYNTWIAANPLTEFRLVGNDRAIGVITSPTAFYSMNLEKNFYAQIKEVLDAVTGLNSELQFRVGTPVPGGPVTGQSSFSSPTPEVITSFSPHVSTPQASQLTPVPAAPPLTSQVSSSVRLSSPSSQDALQTGEPQSSPPLPETHISNSITDIQSKLRTLAQAKPATPELTTGVQPYSTRAPLPQPHRGRSPSPLVEDLFSPTTVQSMTFDRALLQAQKAGLRLDYTFDTFAVSTTNELAHAAAFAVSNQPGTAYNPLFIYGGVGVGKTHLMHAVGNNILKNNPESKILYCTGEDFTNEIVSAIQNKKAMFFKEKFRTVDVLLIDDVQFIAGKNTVQEEFFHTFNTITKRLGQIILTSDRPPHEISLLEDRLKSRFEAGLMVDIQQPSFELRTAILLIKANSYSLHIPMNLAQFIASKVDSARKIEGILKIIKSEVELKHREITPEMINEIFKLNEAEKPKERLRMKPFELIKAVADFYHIKQQTLRGPQRVKSIVKARHIAMFFLKEELKLPYMEIGRWFSNRDHTSAMHGIKKIQEELAENDELRQEAIEIRTLLAKLSK